MRSFHQYKEQTRLGSLLVKKGVLSTQQLQQAVSNQGDLRLGDYLLAHSLITEKQLKRTLQRQRWLRFVALILAFVLSPFSLGYAQESIKKADNPHFLHQRSLNSPLHQADVEPSDLMTESASLARRSVDSGRMENRYGYLYGSDLSFEAAWEIYDSLLLEHTWEGVASKHNVTLVDYRELGRGDKMMELIRLLERLSPDVLASSHEKLAFYINAYNIFALHQIACSWPIKCLKGNEAAYPVSWTQTAGLIGGQAMTLRRIEQDVLGNMREPRIYFALCCGAVSAPVLRQEAYRADLIFEQLNDQVEQFVYDHKGVYQRGAQTYISTIFNWHERAFDEFGGIRHFITKFRPGLQGKYNFQGYLPYDWSVNAHLNRKEIKKLAT